MLRESAPLTVAEIKAHPEYPHVDWSLKPTKKAHVTVAQSRGGPFKLAYEIHGHGPHKILWIMGLGGWMRAWQRQTKDFGHLQADQYTCLIFDNRGIGASDKPLLRYSTSEMAKDTMELLEHVGWTEQRSVHVCGISMGGMVAQELALQIPDRISSLNLISTAPRIVRTLPYLENLRNRINLMIPKSLDEQIEKIKYDCYSAEWLWKPDDAEHTVSPFSTNGDRISAGEIDKRTTPGALTKTGFLCQLAAAGFHHKSAEQLKQLADAVGRERILVVHGKQDRMIGFIHAEMLLRELGGEKSGVTASFHEQLGHVMPIEMRNDFKTLIERRIETCAGLGKA